MEKQSGISIVEYYLVITIHELLTYATKCTGFKCIILSERSEIQKVKHYAILFIWLFEKSKNYKDRK